MKVAAVCVGKVHPLRLRPDFVPLETCLADGGGIDERSELLQFCESLFLAQMRSRSPYLDVLGEQAVEEVDIGCAKMSQILVLVNRSVLRSEKPQTCGIIRILGLR